jgi:hypothetical protein
MLAPTDGFFFAVMPLPGLSAVADGDTFFDLAPEFAG